MYVVVILVTVGLFSLGGSQDIRAVNYRYAICGIIIALTIYPGRMARKHAALSDVSSMIHKRVL